MESSREAEQLGGWGDRYTVAWGSVVGQEHVRLGRNNQDAVELRAEDGLIVAVVTDGCSSGRASEVGARLGAAWLAGWIPKCWSLERDEECFCEAVGIGLAGYLSEIGRGLRPTAEDWSATVKDYLLFTFLAAVISPEKTLIFGLGDGVYSVNGKATGLEAGPGNAPAYLAYRLVGSSLLEGGAGQLDPMVHHSAETGEIESLVIGTDGVLDLLSRADEPLEDGRPQLGLEQFERDPRYLRNPSLLQKRLTVIGKENRRLPDDTTMALLRRRDEE